MWKKTFIVIAIVVVVTTYGCSKNITPGTSAKEEEKVLTRKERVSYQYAFTEGMKKKMTGKLKEAVTYFKECLRIKPESDASYYEISNILSMTGDYEEALEFLQDAIRIDPENIWYKLQKANLYLAMGRNDSTIEVYEKIHEDFPERMDLYFNLATLHGQYGDVKKAISIYDELEKKYGANEKVSLAKQQAYSRSGNYQKAEQELLKMIELHPQETRFYGILAELYSSQGKNELAEEVYFKMFEKDPENGLVQLSAIEFYRKQGKYDRVFTYLEKAIENNDIGVNRKIQIMITFLTNEAEFNNNISAIEYAVKMLAEQYNGDTRIRALKADYHMKLGEFEEAVFELRYVTRREKNNYLAWEQLMYMENALEEYDSLYHSSSEAITLFESAANLYLLKGIACMKLKKNKEAIYSLKSGLGKVENNKELLVQFYIMLGEVYRNDGNNDLSDESFQNALEQDSENLFVLNNYSYYLSLREEKLEQALEMSKICIEKEPENSTYLDTHGWVLYKLQEYEKARKYLEKAVIHNEGESSEIVEHYGDVLLIFGDKKKALQQWERAKEMGKVSVELDRKIAKIKLEIQK